jgi:hypothetical protein
MGDRLDAFELSSNEFHAYDVSGEQDVSAATTIDQDTTTLNTNTSVYAISSGTLTVTASGSFVVEAKVSLGVNVGDGDYSAQVWLERDSGSGFVELPGSRSFV